MPGSHKTYWAAREIAAKGYSFYALLQATIRRADSDNLSKLKAIWPEVVAEIQARYVSPGGYLEGEEVPDDFPFQMTNPTEPAGSEDSE